MLQTQHLYLRGHGVISTLRAIAADAGRLPAYAPERIAVAIALVLEELVVDQ